MAKDEQPRIETWSEIEDAIARLVEARLAAEMIDVSLAGIRAREFAAASVRLICETLGGQDVYVPKIARHHREERDTQLRSNFSGDCKSTARSVSLSVRHIRNIIREKKGNFPP